MLHAATLLMFVAAVQDQDLGDLKSLEGVNLHEITVWIQHKTGFRFLWTEELGLKNKKIYFRASKGITDPKDLFRTYQSFLQVNDLFLVPVEGATETTYKIQTGATMTKKSIPIVRGPVVPEDRVVTRIFKLMHVSTREAHAVLINMVSFPHAILPIESSGVLLVTDYDHNLKRLETVIEELDRPSVNLETAVIPLRHRNPEEMQSILTKVGVTMNLSKMRGVPNVEHLIRVVPDTATRSVIVVSDRATIESLKKLVEVLDVAEKK